MCKPSDIQHLRQYLRNGSTINIQEVEYFLDDIIAAHNALDRRDIPRADQAGLEYTLEQRIFEGLAIPDEDPVWQFKLPDSYVDILAYFGGDRFGVINLCDEHGWTIDVNQGEVIAQSDPPVAWMHLPTPPTDYPGPIELDLDDTTDPPTIEANNDNPPAPVDPGKIPPDLRNDPDLNAFIANEVYKPNIPTPHHNQEKIKVESHIPEKWFKAQYFLQTEDFSRWDDIGTFTEETVALRNARNWKERHPNAFTRVIQLPEMTIIWPTT